MNRSERAIELVHTFFEDAQTRPILDLGCGYGETETLLLADGFNDLTCLEYDASTIEKTRDAFKGSDIRFVQEPGEHMSFVDESFDLVLSLDVLEHVQSDAEVVGEIARVLKSEGIFVGSVPYRGVSFLLDPENILSLLKRKKPVHHHYTIRELTVLLDPHFENVTFERRGMGLSQLVFLSTYILRPFLKETVMRLQKKVSHWEFARQFGFLSYHVVFTGRLRQRD
ncbi:methyltransferase domain-containing protein [Candidatus Uhrbacteria bacterium]|jgi:SAM-dependent methyltransferase|nr:methyltransferase domain-containing protein [Candidatus Uhrbacteria bacterium]